MNVENKIIYFPEFLIMQRKEEAQMRRALELINSYDGAEPLLRYLNKHFQQNKNMGARDRRLYSNLIHGYFRIKGNFQISEQQKIIALAAWMFNSVEFSSYWLPGYFENYEYRG